MDEKYNSNCDMCNASLERGYSTRGRWEGEKWVELETVCFACDKKERYEEWEKTGRLRTRLITDAVLENCSKRYKEPHDVRYNDVYASYERIESKINEFERNVWFNGMKPVVRDCKMKGMSAKVGDIKVLTYDMCGRCMVTIDSPNDSITTIIGSDAPEGYREHFPDKEYFMGLQGVDGKEGDVINLLDEVIRAWNGDNRFQLVEDAGVGMI